MGVSFLREVLDLGLCVVFQLKPENNNLLAWFPQVGDNESLWFQVFVSVALLPQQRLQLRMQLLQPGIVASASALKPTDMVVTWMPSAPVREMLLGCASTLPEALNPHK